MSDEPPSPQVIVEAAWRDLHLDLDHLVAAAVTATWRRLSGLHGLRNVEIGVRFTDDATIARLNGAWRGQAKATDVLAFPTTAPGEPWPSGGPLLLGDVVLALETCRADARALDRPLASHVTHLVVHGLLHLVHHDHGTAAEARRMEALEASILADLGLPDPYLGRPLPEEIPG